MGNPVACLKVIRHITKARQMLTWRLEEGIYRRTAHSGGANSGLPHFPKNSSHGCRKGDCVSFVTFW